MEKIKNFFRNILTQINKFVTSVINKFVPLNGIKSFFSGFTKREEKS